MPASMNDQQSTHAEPPRLSEVESLEAREHSGNPLECPRCAQQAQKREQAPKVGCSCAQCRLVAETAKHSRFRPAGFAAEAATAEHWRGAVPSGRKDHPDSVSDASFAGLSQPVQDASCMPDGMHPVSAGQTAGKQTPGRDQGGWGPESWAGGTAPNYSGTPPNKFGTCRSQAWPHQQGTACEDWKPVEQRKWERTLTADTASSPELSRMERGLEAFGAQEKIARGLEGRAEVLERIGSLTCVTEQGRLKYSFAADELRRAAFLIRQQEVRVSAPVAQRHEHRRT